MKNEVIQGKIKSLTGFNGVLPYDEINKQEQLVLKDVEKIGELKTKKFTEYTFLVNGGNVVQAKASGNLRAPKVTAASKSMYSTIQLDGDTFLAKNGGISYNASKIEHDEENNSVTLYFDGAITGCINGNHTSCVLVTAQNDGLDLSEVYVKVFVKVYHEIDKQELTEIALGMNKSEKQIEYAEGELLGYHDKFKTALGRYSNVYDWIPNAKQRDALAIRKTPFDLISLLTLWDVKKHQKDSKGLAKSHPTGVIMGKAAPYREWLRQVKAGKVPTYYVLLPILKELVAFEDELVSNFHRYGANFSNNGTLSCKEIGEKYLLEKLNLTLNKRGLFTLVSGRVPKYVPEVQILSPIMSAYRANLEYNAETETVSWIVDPYELMRLVNKDLVDTVVNAYRAHGGKTKNIMCRKSNTDMWDNMYNKVTLAIMQLQKEQAA